MTRDDQWQVQTLMECLEKARVVLFSERSPADRAHARAAYTKDPIRMIHQFVEARGGSPLGVAIFAEGRLSIACPPA